MGEEKEKRLQWHPAFFASLQIELENEADFLEFESEHMLGSKPMQLDVLVIKKDRNYKVRKNIGRNFRTYNIVEYKSPEDYLSIDDFYKVYGYTCFYKSDTCKVNGISADELTISLICSHYPRETIKYLQQKGRIITPQQEGIYLISDDEFIIQLIVTNRLSEKDNLWLKNLTNDLRENEIALKLIEDYRKHEKNTLYRSVMNVIVKANEERFQEVDSMCEALEELFKDKIDAKIEAGIEAGIQARVAVEMKKVEKISMERGMAQGMAQGVAQGEQRKLLSLVHGKYMSSDVLNVSEREVHCTDCR